MLIEAARPDGACLRFTKTIAAQKPFNDDCIGIAADAEKGNWEIAMSVEDKADLAASSSTNERRLRPRSSP